MLTQVDYRLLLERIKKLEQRLVELEKIYKENKQIMEGQACLLKDNEYN